MNDTASVINWRLPLGLLLILAFQTANVGLIVIFATHLLALTDFMHHAASILPDQVLAIRFLFVLSPAAFLLPPIIGKYSDKNGHERTVFLFLLLSLFGNMLVAIGVLYVQPILVLLGILFFTVSFSNILLINAIIVKHYDHHKKTLFFTAVFAMIAIMVPLAEIFSYFLNKHLSQSLRVIAPAIFNCIFSLLSIGVFLFVANTNTKIPEINLPNISENEAMLRRIHIFRLKKWFAYFGVITFIWGLFYQGEYLLFWGNMHAFYNELAEFVMYGSIIILLVSVFFCLFFLKKITLKKLIYLGTLLFCVGFLGHGLFLDYALKKIFIVFINMGVCFTIPGLWVLLTEETECNDQGFLMGILSSIWVLSWLLSGLTVRFARNISTHLPTDIGIMLVVIFLVLLLGKTIKSPQVMRQ